jgi:flagellar basal body rod protein FlgB
VTRASLQNADGFAVALDAAQPGSSGDGPIDVEAEMVSLADEQLRFEATARLLEKTYQRIRTSLKSQ